MILIISMLFRCFLLLAITVTPSYSEVYMTLKQGLKAAFPNAKRVIRTEIYLQGNDKAKIEDKFSVTLNSAYYVRYKMLNDGEILGYAYIDRHVVRSKMESILIAFDKSTKVKRVLTLAFEEPLIYVATATWLGAFFGKDPNKLNMPGMLGSTITAHRIIESVRRLGSIHQFTLDKY